MANSFKVGDITRYADRILHMWPEYEQAVRFKILEVEVLSVQEIIKVEIVESSRPCRIGEITYRTADYLELASAPYYPDIPAEPLGDNRFDLDL